MQPLITLRNVSVNFGAMIALQGIDLEIEAGEVISLIGPNGAGKSTLARLLLGLITPSLGTRTTTPNLRTAYVPQRFDVSASLPLRVIDVLNLERVLPAHQAAIINDTEIQSLLMRPVQALSGGQTQRVLLARALLRQPQLLVLDEPMQGLDPLSEAALYRYIREIPVRYGCAIFMISHDLHWVMQGTHRVICLNKHICCSGLPAQIQHDPAYVALFGAQRVWYQHHHDHCQHDNLHDELLQDTPSQNSSSLGALPKLPFMLNHTHIRRQP